MILKYTLLCDMAGEQNGKTIIVGPCIDNIVGHKFPIALNNIGAAMFIQFENTDEGIDYQFSLDLVNPKDEHIPFKIKIDVKVKDVEEDNTSVMIVPLNVGPHVLNDVGVWQYVLSCNNEEIWRSKVKVSLKPLIVDGPKLVLPGSDGFSRN